MKKLEQRVTDQECIARNVNSEGSATAILNREAEASLEFVGQEFEGTKRQLERIRESLANIEKRLTNFEERLLNLESTLDDLQNYSYSFNVKVLGVPELSDSESAADTSSLCVRLFNAMGSSVSEQDIDIAHCVPLRDSSRGGPRPIICKFTRRLARNEVMTLSKEANKVSTSDVGFDEDRIMSNARVVEHLTPKLQKLFVDAKAFKDQYQYAFCWVKNGSILLRKMADSRPIRVKSSANLANLTRQEQIRRNSSSSEISQA